MKKDGQSLFVRVSISERARIERLAATAGMSVSDHVRLQAMRPDLEAVVRKAQAALVAACAERPLSQMGERALWLLNSAILALQADDPKEG